MNKHHILIFMAVLVALGAGAQTNGSNSSYSRFGLGTLADQSQGFNRGMGGAGIGVRIGNRVNMQNPASYSAIDSLSFIFDVGMNVSLGHLSSSKASMNVRNCNIDFVNAGLRLRPGLGLSFGFVPFTTIGYNFSLENNVARQYPTSQTITSTSTYSGNGGLHQLYVGLGWKAIGELSVGANVGYLWGNFDHELIQSFAENGTNTSSYSGLNSKESADLATYKIDLGLQYPVRIDAENLLTLGVTAGLGHRINRDATLTRYSTAGDSLKMTARHPFDLPYTFGLGATWQRKENLLVAADVKQEQWADCKVPTITSATGTALYAAQRGAYLNRTRVAVGAQYIPDIYADRFVRRMHYRAGAHYSTPYLKINGKNGPSEFGLTAGVGLPITTYYNNRSMINVNLQWLRRAPSEKGMISEDFFMVNLSMTFNERWFMKFKIQ
ncbi:MAG: hypothetical protein K5945_05790 [Bacteroidaceae bacterium]|nr:hypothetical protein [Bacteroidaceae bacterium]